ncbi:hypothetical protein KEM09_17080 [Carboxylicivirga mesophila]|uniref:DUF1735 domain-containing protein n=1 Tax=Carboxylicivirga mesophila TaxID=1166478 RepID=A0ABS5KDM3_9BACT|nr:hypothetical protein [Carboxylicivirga mesophila]MBS2213133.1 hypothetical protein [Carboxylicivirga mesophila]
MKFIYNICIVAFMSLLFVGCETDTQVDIGPRGLGVAATIEKVDAAFFDEGDKENTFVKFTVGLPEGASGVAGAKLQISLNGQSERVDVGDYTTFPADITVKLSDVADALGIGLADIKGGDVVNIEVLTEVNNEFYRSNTAINPLVACAYDPTNLVGDYDVSSSSWGSAGVVTFTQVDGEPYKFEVFGLAAMDGLNEDQGPLIFEVNPLDYSVIAPKATLATSAWGYDNFSYQSSAPGSLNTCSSTFMMSFTITVDQGSFGTYSDYVFVKK